MNEKSVTNDENVTDGNDDNGSCAFNQNLLPIEEKNVKGNVNDASCSFSDSKILEESTTPLLPVVTENEEAEKQLMPIVSPVKDSQNESELAQVKQVEEQSGKDASDPVIEGDTSVSEAAPEARPSKTESPIDTALNIGKSNTILEESTKKIEDQESSCSANKEQLNDEEPSIEAKSYSKQLEKETGDNVSEDEMALVIDESVKTNENDCTFVTEGANCEENIEVFEGDGSTVTSSVHQPGKHGRGRRRRSRKHSKKPKNEAGNCDVILVCLKIKK